MAVFLVRNYCQEKLIRLKKIKSIQLKAACLLVVFSLNTIVGFACALGLDMGFNTEHHQDDAAEQSVHMHADGKNHVHPKAHTHHAEAENHHHNEAAKSFNKCAGEDNCCTDAVVKITQTDKVVPQSATTILHPFFFTAFISSFYYPDALNASYVDTRIKQFVRSHHPPIPDIRIAIQSFQI